MVPRRRTLPSGLTLTLLSEPEDGLPVPERVEPGCPLPDGVTLTGSAAVPVVLVDTDRCTAGFACLSGFRAAHLRLEGDRRMDAARAGSGDGDAVRGPGPGSVARLGDGTGRAVLEVPGLGDALRLGGGSGGVVVPASPDRTPAQPAQPGAPAAARSTTLWGRTLARMAVLEDSRLALEDQFLSTPSDSPDRDVLDARIDRLEDQCTDLASLLDGRVKLADLLGDHDLLQQDLREVSESSPAYPVRLREVEDLGETLRAIQSDSPAGAPPARTDPDRSPVGAAAAARPDAPLVRDAGAAVGAERPAQPVVRGSAGRGPEVSRR